MIEVESISKRWGDVVALDDVSLSVGRGEVCGLIGADGAGKSTLFDILVTLTRADGGSARVGGYEIGREWRKVRRTVGYMPAAFSLYGDLSVRENLEFFARIYRKPAGGIEELVGDIWRQIEPFSRRPAAKLSGGMKQKLALCCAMIHDPEVLMLDEPTTGVDPTSRSEFWDALRRLAVERGKTILVSTSYMDEAARCDRVSLLHRGELLDTLVPGEVAEHYRGTLYEISTEDMKLNARLLGVLRDWSLCRGCYSFGDRIHLGMALDGMHVETVLGYLRAQGFDTGGAVRVRQAGPTVEDLFIQLTSSVQSAADDEDDLSTTCI